MQGRVVVAEPGLDVELTRDLLHGVADAVERVTTPWSGDDVVALLVGPDVRVDDSDLDRLPALRVVSTASVGFDHIDLEAARKRAVWVCNVPDYCIEEMADHSLALVLALLRGIVVLDRTVRDGAWDHRAAGSLRRIAGTRLGVVGCGRIGRALAARAAAVGFEVWGYDPLISSSELEALGIRPAALDELLASCSAISLHAPLTPHTRGMIGAEQLASMPDGAVVVNTARAGLLDVDALLAALDAGKLQGAALDVLPVEPPGPQAPVPRHRRLIVTPHAGWYSPRAESEVYRRAVLAVRDVLEDRVPADAVVDLGA